MNFLLQNNWRFLPYASNICRHFAHERYQIVEGGASHLARYDLAFQRVNPSRQFWLEAAEVLFDGGIIAPYMFD